MRIEPRYSSIETSFVKKGLESFVDYWPHHFISIETKKYLLKTASTLDELQSVFSLRYTNFLGDEQEGLLDFDEFDNKCDHLIIKNKETDRVIGTYRVLCSSFTDSFYSQTEFDLDGFLQEDALKLELGRACIDPDHRNGYVIDLLWHGIGHYAKKTGTRYLFGCSSIKTIDHELAFNIFTDLKKKGLCEEKYNINPIGKYRMNFASLKFNEGFSSKEFIPPLLRSYMMAGARVYGSPALDLEFKCIDLFTILDIENIAPSYGRRYFEKVI